MDKQTLQAEVREGRGKGPARQLRMGGKIPAVLYGQGVDSVALSVDPTELTKALKTLWRRNVLIDLKVGDDSHNVVVRDLQVHPISREVRHADFYKVGDDQKVKYKVPLKTSGRAAGVAMGGSLNVMYRTLPVQCTPDKVPAAITVDVRELEMLDSVKVSELSLEDGVEVLMAPERICVFCEAEKKRGKKGEEEEKTEEAAS